MKYLQQFGIILAVSFVGELLNYAIPLSIPASIYGLVLMFVCLCMKWIKLEDVKETAVFLIEIMPLMFIPAGSGTDYFMEHYPSEAAGLCSNYSYIYPFGNAGIRICNRLDAEGRKERRG